MINIYDFQKIGDRIKTERTNATVRSHTGKEKSMTQSDLADELGVTRQTIAKWEHGEDIPQLSDFLRLCNLFGCELGYMLCEYDCKTRAATDIQAETGLSEMAIGRIAASTSGRGIRMYTQSRDLDRKALDEMLVFNGGEILTLIAEYLFNEEKPVELGDGRVLTSEAIATSYLLEISGELQALRGKLNGGAK